jgi:hypothetical protein
MIVGRVFVYLKVISEDELHEKSHLMAQMVQSLSNRFGF